MKRIWILLLLLISTIAISYSGKIYVPDGLPLACIRNSGDIPLQSTSYYHLMLRCNYRILGKNVYEEHIIGAVGAGESKCVQLDLPAHRS